MASVLSRVRDFLPRISKANLDSNAARTAVAPEASDKQMIEMTIGILGDPSEEDEEGDDDDSGKSDNDEPHQYEDGDDDDDKIVFPLAPADHTKSKSLGSEHLGISTPLDIESESSLETDDALNGL